MSIIRVWNWHQKCMVSFQNDMSVHAIKYLGSLSFMDLS